jgi:hypothetical protein
MIPLFLQLLSLELAADNAVTALKSLEGATPSTLRKREVIRAEMSCMDSFYRPTTTGWSMSNNGCPNCKVPSSNHDNSHP